MAAGPHEQRLRTYLAPARGGQVFIAKEQWKKGATSLKTVADAVQQVGPLARANLGSHTADAADQAFVAMHAEVLAREQQMREATVALQAALDAIGRAEAVRNDFDAQGPLSEPSPPDWDEDEVRRIQQMRSHRARMSAYTSQVAAREEAALAATQDLDSTNTSSAETMRKIQGERPEVPSSGGGGGDGGLPPTGDRTAVPGPPNGPRPNPATSPPTEEPRLPGETGTPLAPSAGTTPVGMPGTLASPAPVAAVDVGTIGGLAGAVGGGLAGGARGPGGVSRGGSPEVGVSGTCGTTRVIGCSAPAGSAGALGRSSAAGSAAEPGTAARGAGGRGLDPGAAGGAGGRGGRKNEDDDGVQVEAVIDDQDWVDAEDAAPAVIS